WWSSSCTVRRSAPTRAASTGCCPRRPLGCPADRGGPGPVPAVNEPLSPPHVLGSGVHATGEGRVSGHGFDEFVLARGPALLRFAYLLTGDGHLAHDVTQEVLVRAHRRWDRIERLDVPEAYLRKAILREYLSWRRLRARTEVIVADLPDRVDHRDLAEQAVVR